MKWISIKEKLPDYDENVLWIDEQGFQFVAEINHNNRNFQSWHKDIDDNIIKITHWMPLPEPPINALIQ